MVAKSNYIGEGDIVANTSLLDTLDNNRKKLTKRSGLLTEETVPTNQLASSSGLPAAPTDPASVAAIGGSSKQQDMAGTPNQLASATRQNIEPGQSLQDLARRKQASSQTTSSEDAELKKGADLQGLGGLGGRVQGLINKFIPGTSTANTKLQTAPQASLVVPTGKEVEVKEAASALVANPADQNALLKLNTALGRGATNLVTPEQASQLYKDSVSTIAAAASESTKDNLMVSDLLQNGGMPGYTSESLKQLLGVPADGMTLRQFQDHVDNMIRNEFNRTQATQNTATSNLSGSAERNEARSVGQDLSAAGIAAIENQTQQLGEQIDRADRVTVGGKQYTVSELLTDSNIERMVSEYLANPNSEQSKQLAAGSPEFTKWITSNKDVLDESLKKIGKGIDTFAATQKSNATVGTFGKVQLAPALLDKLLPDRNKLSSTNVSTGNIPIFQFISALPPEKQELAASNVNKLLEEFPDLVGDVSTFSARSLSKLGLDGDWNTNKYIIALRRNRKAADLNMSGDDPDALVRTLSGGTFNSLADAQKQYTQARTLASLGLPANLSQYKALDVNSDGIIDSPDKLVTQANTSRKSLSDVMNNVDTGRADRNAPTINKMVPISYGGVVDKIAPFANDGVLSEEEIGKSGVSLDEANSVSNPPLHDKLVKGIARVKQHDLIVSNQDKSPEDLDKLANEIEANADKYGVGSDYIRGAANSLRALANEKRDRNRQNDIDAEAAKRKADLESEQEAARQRQADIYKYNAKQNERDPGRKLSVAYKNAFEKGKVPSI